MDATYFAWQGITSAVTVAAYQVSTVSNNKSQDRLWRRVCGFRWRAVEPTPGKLFLRCGVKAYGIMTSYDSPCGGSDDMGSVAYITPQSLAIPELLSAGQPIALFMSEVEHCSDSMGVDSADHHSEPSCVRDDAPRRIFELLGYRIVGQREVRGVYLACAASRADFVRLRLQG